MSGPWAQAAGWKAWEAVLQARDTPAPPPAGSAAWEAQGPALRALLAHWHELHYADLDKVLCEGAGVDDGLLSTAHFSCGHELHGLCDLLGVLH